MNAASLFFEMFGATGSRGRSPSRLPAILAWEGERPASRSSRNLLLAIAITATLCAACRPAYAQEPVAEEIALRTIEPAVVDYFRGIPIQDGGRIKPLDTYARFLLLKLHGRRSLRMTDAGQPVTISATEWLVTSLVYPEWAVHYPTFNLDNSDVVVAIGALPHAKRRDRYSYAELFPARGRLMELATQYNAIDQKQRSPHQSMVLNLAANLADFEVLLQMFSFAREKIPVAAAQFGTLAPAEGEMPVSAYLRILPDIRTQMMQAAGSNATDKVAAMSAQIGAVQQTMENASYLALIPPSDPAVAAWLSPGEVMSRAFSIGASTLPEFAYLPMIETLIASRESPPAFRVSAEALSQALVAACETRGEYGKVGLEVRYYRANLLFWALFGFLLSFLCMTFEWLIPMPHGSWARRAGGVVRAAARLTLAAATVALVAAITMRCIIRGRPPVSTLYETILFITAITMIVSAILEWVNRKGIAIALAPVLGALGMFLAAKYEAKEAIDTMPSLQAVLDTNFWLSTHVTCVTIGYSASLLAGAIAHLYVLGRLFHIKGRDESVYATLAQMTYSVLCFGLFFSFVGTMLGGIWANYSWGRFWGWDPKENGALLIVLWQLLILHARAGHYVQDLGVCLLAILGGCVVAFSWWCVNLLGVGLHSYGFTQGIWGWLIIFWTVEVIIAGLGLVWKQSLRRALA